MEPDWRLHIADDAAPGCWAPAPWPVPPPDSSERLEGKPEAWLQDPAGSVAPLAVRAPDGGLRVRPGLRSMIDTVRFELYAGDASAPVHARLPVDYRAVPATVRLGLNRMAARLAFSKTRDQAGFPRWPMEPGLDLLRLAAAEPAGECPWPRGKRCVVVLTHDLETAAGYGRVKRFTEIEEKRGFRSSWNVVANQLRTRSRAELVRGLADRGFEIGVHDLDHDNRLATLSPAAMRSRLEQAVETVGGLARVRGFRSPSLIRSRTMYEQLAGLFGYDSSAPDTEPPSLVNPRPNGCATVFPFRRNGLWVLPVTVPMDWTLLARGFRAEAILDLWLEKLEHIVRMGGLAMLVTHPDPSLSGNRPMLEVYDRFLARVAGDDRCLVMLAGELAAHLNSAGARELLPRIEV